MAARKLQTEIDRTLKKVSEGVELFESIYDKMQASTNQTQKEKLELDLKTQIKKLQRLRDQIKTWVASNDIKDKSALLDNRKLIETQMEKFKACEKEMKTKAFSKEGLIQAAKLDPKEQEKEEATTWLQTQVEELQMQVEQTEAEVESLQGTGKKRNKGTSNVAGRAEELENLNERRKWHISRLEIILRLLNNGSLSSEKVFALKEDVQYFVESNTEEDFDEDEGIYDDLNLDEEEEKFGLAADDDNSSDSDDMSDDIPIIKKASVPKAKPPPNPNFAQQPMSSIVKAGLQTSRPIAPVTMPPIRYAAAAAAAVSSSNTFSNIPLPGSQPPSQSSHHTPTVSPPTSSVSQAPLDQQSGLSSSPSLTHPSITSPILSSASNSNQPEGSMQSEPESPAFSEALVGTTDAQPLVVSELCAQTQSPSQDLSPVIRVPQDQATTSTISAQDQQGDEQRPTSTSKHAPTIPRPNVPYAFPGSLSDLVISFDNAKQKAAQRLTNVDQVHKLLEAGHTNIPQPQETEKPKYYVPKHPFQTAPYYPHSPHPTLSSPAIFSQLDVETLFYVFYFQPGSYQQFLAARELKRQSWRFHVKYLTWFQRHSEPQAITEEYEQGVYVYFDWEGSWCQRKKSDFRFEYRYLSED